MATRNGHHHVEIGRNGAGGGCPARPVRGQSMRQDQWRPGAPEPQITYACVTRMTAYASPIERLSPLL